jgi:hypothetical protein
MNYPKDLKITETNRKKYAALTSVGGWLDVHAEGLSLPALTFVGGSLYVRAEFSAPLLRLYKGGEDRRGYLPRT